MNERLERALRIARKLPPEGQEELASAMLALMGAEDDEPLRLSEEEKAAIAISMEQADRGEFVTDKEMEALWKKYS